MERGQKPEGFSPPVESHTPPSPDRRPPTETVQRPKKPEKPASKEKAAKPAEKAASKPTKPDIFALLGMPERSPKESPKPQTSPEATGAEQTPAPHAAQQPEAHAEARPRQPEVSPEERITADYLHVADQFQHVGTTVLGLLEQTADAVRHAPPTETSERREQLESLASAHAELDETLDDLDEVAQDLRAHVEEAPSVAESQTAHYSTRSEALNQEGGGSTPAADYDGGDAATRWPDVPAATRSEAFSQIVHELADTQHALEKTDRKARQARALSVGVGAVTAFELYRTHKLKKEVKGLRKEQRIERRSLQEQRDSLAEQRDQLAQQTSELQRLRHADVRSAEPLSRQTHVSEVVQFARQQAVSTETFSQELRDHQERVARRAVVASQQREKLKKPERPKAEREISEKRTLLTEQKLGLAAAEVAGARLVVERPKPKNAEQLPKPTVQVERAERTELGPVQQPTHHGAMSGGLQMAGDTSAPSRQNATISQKSSNDLTLSVDQQLRQTQLQKSQTRHAQPWLLGLSLLAGAILLILIVAAILQR